MTSLHENIYNVLCNWACILIRLHAGHQNCSLWNETKQDRCPERTVNVRTRGTEVVMLQILKFALVFYKPSDGYKIIFWGPTCAHLKQRWSESSTYGYRNNFWRPTWGTICCKGRNNRRRPTFQLSEQRYPRSVNQGVVFIVVWKL
jgi:hypothetical protein